MEITAEIFAKIGATDVSYHRLDAFDNDAAIVLAVQGGDSH